MDLPSLTEALAWLAMQQGRTVGTRLHPRACLLAVWLRESWGAEAVYVDDQVVRVCWPSGWRGTWPTPPAYVRVQELLDWSCGPAGTMAISIGEAHEAIGRVLGDMQEEQWDATCL